MQISTTGEVMRKNDRLSLPTKPQGFHVYPAEEDGVVRIHIDLFVPTDVAKEIVKLFSAELLKQNGK